LTWNELAARLEPVRRRTEARIKSVRCISVFSVSLVVLVVLSGCATCFHERRSPASTSAGSTPATVAPLSSTVPPGFLLKQIDIDQKATAKGPARKGYLLTDFQGERLRIEISTDGALRFVQVTTEGRTASIATFDSSSLRIHESKFDDLQKTNDLFAGLPATLLREESVDGRAENVYRVVNPRGRDQEITWETAIIFVEKDGGLRVREEWMVGTETVRVVTRRLVRPTPTLDASLHLDSVGSSGPTSVKQSESCLT
jgi:hypothetical protein